MRLADLITDEELTAFLKEQEAIADADPTELGKRVGRKNKEVPFPKYHRAVTQSTGASIGSGAGMTVWLIDQLLQRKGQKAGAA